MKLADLRRLSIRQEARIHFRIQNGMECIITEHGLAQVPGLSSIPDFNLEQELAAAGEFLFEPVLPSSKPRQMPRAELESMLGATTSTAAAHEHEEE